MSNPNKLIPPGSRSGPHSIGQSLHASCFCFQWKNARVVIEGIDEELFHAMSRLMGLPFTREEGREGVSVDLICTAEGGLYRFPTGEQFACANRQDLLMTLISLSCVQLLKTTEESIIHGGGFTVEGRVVVFCGPPFTGKSSLAYTAWKLKFPVLGDDWIVVDPQKGTASASPKPIKKRLPSGAAPEDMEPSVSTHDCLVGRLMSGEYRLLLGKGLANMTPLGQEFPVAAFFLVARAKDERTVIETATREEALSTILSQTLPTQASRLRMLKLIEKLRQGGRVHRIVVGENDIPGAVRMMAERAGQ